MSRTIITAAALCLAAAAAPAFAAEALTPPPVKPAAQYAQANAVGNSAQASSTREASQLEPTAEDMAKARKDAEQKRQATNRVTRYESPKGTINAHTKIEEYHDQNNRVTEVKVTSGITEIPYTMENKSDRPIDTAPGQNPQSTLGTTKFIKFGW